MTARLARWGMLAAAVLVAVAAFCAWNAPERRISRLLGKAFALLEKESGENPVVAAGKASRFRVFLANDILVGSRQYGIKESTPRDEFVRELFAARGEFVTLAVESGEPTFAFPAKGEADVHLPARARGENPWWPEDTKDWLLDLRLRKAKRAWRLEALSFDFAEK